VSIDEDQAWFEALAGAATAAAAPDAAQSRAVQEARALREFIQAEESEVDAEVPAVDAARENELIERARAEGLLPAATSARAGVERPMPGGARRRRFTAVRRAFAAAAVLIVAVGVAVFRSMLPPAETFRGAESGIVHLETRDPPALKRRLTEELSAAGVRVVGYERLGHVGIDADLPQPLPAQVRRILERHQIPIPADGVLTVEVDAEGTQ